MEYGGHNITVLDKLHLFNSRVYSHRENIDTIVLLL